MSYWIKARNTVDIVKQTLSNSGGKHFTVPKIRTSGADTFVKVNVHLDLN